ncbi:MAG: GIY-YIG nuclease family protein [Candidatus Bathyarchaeota archaeon]|jgi:Uri superfamily endonuclease
MKKDKSHLKFMTQGIYALVIFLSKEITLEIGKLGNHQFPRGYYIYTGSALGKGSTSLKNRLTRHLRKEKQRFWHIDYLLANENTSIKMIIVAQTIEKKECLLNKFLLSLEETVVQLKGFGSSDCRNKCSAHLSFFPELRKKEILVRKIITHLNSEMRIQNAYVLYDSDLND